MEAFIVVTTVFMGISIFIIFPIFIGVIICLMSMDDEK